MRYINNLQGFLLLFATCRPHSLKNNVFCLADSHPSIRFLLAQSTWSFWGGPLWVAAKKRPRPNISIHAEGFVHNTMFFFDIATFLERKCTQKIVGQFLRIVQIATL